MLNLFWGIILTMWYVKKGIDAIKKLGGTVLY